MGYCNCVGRSTRRCRRRFRRHLAFWGRLESGIYRRSICEWSGALCAELTAARRATSAACPTIRSRSLDRSSDYKSQATDTTAECCRLAEVFSRVEGHAFKLKRREEKRSFRATIELLFEICLANLDNLWMSTIDEMG